jgi:hypothetical protein
MSDASFQYKGYWIVRTGVRAIRVKKYVTDDYALHHGSFSTKQEAKAWIDNQASSVIERMSLKDEVIK